MTSALLLIDLQNDYFPGGAMEVAGAIDAGHQAQKLLSTFRRQAMSVIHVRHTTLRAGATFLLPNTIGAEIHAVVAPRDGEFIVHKHYPNSFRETALLEHLRSHRITRLVIAGMMTHMCVDTSTRAAADLGFDCLLAHDACATRALSFKGVQVPAESVQVAYLAALNGLFARVKSAGELCAEATDQG